MRTKATFRKMTPGKPRDMKAVDFIRIQATGKSRMMIAGRFWAWSVLAFMLLTDVLTAGIANGDVSVFDQVATPARPFYLKLRTHHGPLAMGGIRGTFWIDDRRVGPVLTGVDGYGFLKHTATRTGVFTLRAETAAGGAEARLLVVDTADRVVLFEAETLLWRALNRDRETNGHRIMRQIAEDFEMIYICGLMGKTITRQLIKDKTLPDRVILEGKGQDQFAQLSNRGVHIFAVVGTSAFLKAAGNFSPRHFSFEKSSQARYVADWEDLLNQLNQEGEAP